MKSSPTLVGFANEFPTRDTSRQSQNSSETLLVPRSVVEVDSAMAEEAQELLLQERLAPVVPLAELWELLPGESGMHNRVSQTNRANQARIFQYPGYL